MQVRRSRRPLDLRRYFVAFLLFLALFILQAQFAQLTNLNFDTVLHNVMDTTLVYQNDIRSCPSLAVSAKVKETIQMLTRPPMLRYFVYDDGPFQPRPRTPKTERHGKELFLLNRRYGSFADAEEHIINTLANSSLRIHDPDQADLYFIPISLTRHLITRRERHVIASVFDDLYSQASFQSYQGHRHFMIVQIPNMWSWEHIFLYEQEYAQVAQQYVKLWNVTIGKVFDQEGCEEARKKGLLEGSGFKSMMLDSAVTMSRSSFSLNSIPLAKFPFTPASLAKYRNSTWDCFYHSRREPSMFNSTPYRHALLNTTVVKALPGSSIGFDIHPNQWMEHFQSSRFCLVIRGDSPMSRAHLRAVKVGCIPVIVSNLLEYYSPTFKSSIAMSDYSIILDEDEFLADPIATVLKLNALSEDVICEKLAYLELAQRLFLPDHPESLFVPALLHEVNESMTNHASKYTEWPWRMPTYTKRGG